MKKFKNSAMKRMFSALLSLMLVFGVMPYSPVESKAAEHYDGYKFKVVIDVTNDADGWNWAYLYLYTNSDQNGYGTGQKVKEYTITDEIDDDDDVCTKEFDCGSHFPYGIVLRTDFGGGLTWRQWEADVKLYVNGKLLKSEHVVSSASPFSSSDDTDTINIDRSMYPYPNEFVTKYDNEDEDDYNFYQNSASASTCYGNFIAGAYDQYGVKWKTYASVSNETYPDDDTLYMTSDPETTETYEYMVSSTRKPDHRSKFYLTYSTNNSSCPEVSRSFDIFFHFLYKLELNSVIGTNSEKLGEYYELKGTRFNLPAPNPPEGYHFEEYYFNGDGTLDETNSIYTFGESEASIDYCYSANTYTLHFDGNGSTTGTMKDISCTYDKTKKLTANKFKKDNKAFAGWNTESDGSGESYDNAAQVKNLTSENGGTVTLYAQWASIPHDVHYDYSQEFIDAVEEYNETAPADKQIILDTDIVVNQGDTAAVEEYFNINNENRHYRFASSDVPLEDIQDDTVISLSYSLEDHDYDEPVLAVHETCHTDGYYIETCKGCGYEHIIPIPAKHQGLVAIPAVAPTCTEVGYTEGEKCAVCENAECAECAASGYITVAPQEIPAAGHEYNEPIWDWAEDFSTATATVTCKKCGYQQSRTARLAAREIEYEDVGVDRVYTAAVVFDGVTYHGSATYKNLYTSVPYVDENGEEKTMVAARLTEGKAPVGKAIFVDNEITLTDTFEMADDLTLILCDGGKLNINITESGKEGISLYDPYDVNNHYCKDLTIYGQTNQTGELNVTLNAPDSRRSAIDCGSYKQYGGKVNATANCSVYSMYGSTAAVYAGGFARHNPHIIVKGGELNASSANGYALYSVYGNVYLEGGKITAETQNSSYSGVGTYQGNIILGCSKVTDSITSSGYVPESSGGTVSVAEGKLLYDGENLYSGVLDAQKTEEASGKTLTGHIAHNFVDGVCTLCGAEIQEIPLDVADGKIVLYPTYYTQNGVTYENHCSENVKYIISGNIERVDDILVVENSKNENVNYYIEFNNFTAEAKKYCTLVIFKGTNTVVNLNLRGTNVISASNHPGIRGTGTLNISACCESNTIIRNALDEGTCALDTKLYLNKVGEYDIKAGNNNISLEDAKTNRVITISRNHNWEFVSKTEPTCGADGEEVYNCSYCNETRTDIFPATGEHNWSVTSETAPTCAVEGERSYICTVCGETMTETLPATNKHHFVDGTCTVCGTDMQYITLDVGSGNVAIYPDYYIYNGVTYEDNYWANTTYIITGKKSNAADAVAVYNPENVNVVYNVVFKNLTINPKEWCSVVKFNATNTVVNLALEGTNSIKGHNHGGIIGKATVNISAKCESNTTFSASYSGTRPALSPELVLNKVGDYNVMVGNNNNASLTDAQSSKPLVITFDHAWEETPVVAPTCGESGVSNYVCSLCGAEKTEEVPATGNHTFESVDWSWTEDNKATASIHCSVCGKDYSYDASVTEERLNLKSNYTATVEIGGTTYTDTKTVTRDTNYWISGIKINVNNASDVLGDGTVSYDEATNTLTLDNATLESKKYSSSESFAVRLNQKKSLPLTVLLIGENKIVNETTESGITAVYGFEGYDNDKGYVFTGEGTLDVTMNADNEDITYYGIETRKAASISATQISINLPGTAKAIGYSILYSNTLTLKDNAKLAISTGSNAESYSMANDSSKDNLTVESGSLLEAYSDNAAFNSLNKITSATKALGVGVNTVNSEEGLSLWNGSTDLSTYKYIKIPFIKDMYNLTLQDSIDVNVLIDVAHHNANGEVIESIDYKYIDSTKERKVFIEETDTEVTVGSDGFWKKTFPLAVAQVNEPITVTLNFTNGDSLVKEFSATSYCKYVIDNSAKYGDELVKLCYATLEYGKKAIEYFNYNYTKPYPSYTVPDGMFSAVTYSDIASEASYTAGSDEELRVASTKVYIISKATLRLIFNKDISGLTATVNDDELTAETVKTNDGRWAVDIKGMTAVKLNNAVTVTLSDGTVIKYAATDWSRSILKNSSDEKSKALAAMLYHYSVAADEYFNY